MALHDTLTGLPTRALRQNHLQVGPGRHKRFTTGVALLMLDLDNSKRINDSHRHDLPPADRTCRPQPHSNQLADPSSELLPAPPLPLSYHQHDFPSHGPPYQPIRYSCSYGGSVNQRSAIEHTVRESMPLSHPHLATRTTRLASLVVLAAGLAGCQGVTGIQPLSQVRVIDASPDAPAIDIYQNVPSQPAQASLYNVGFGTISSYIPIAAGPYTHAAYTAGTQQQLAAVRGNFAPGNQYTVLAGNISASLQMAILKDQSNPAPSGLSAFRFLGQATRTGGVDIYLRPAGPTPASVAPIATGLSFGSNTGYINVPAGTYSIVAFPTGTSPSTASPIYTGSQSTYPATSVRTILLLDEQTAQQPSVPGLEIITATDFDPPSN
jgi:hypothetical protein